jgi:hypothetical protein
MRTPIILVLCVVLLTGCDLITDTKAIGTEIEFSTIARGAHIIQDSYESNGFTRKTPEVELFNSIEEAQLYLENKLGGKSLLNKLRTIDFGQKSVILLHLEMQYTGMIETQIESVKTYPGTIRVYATRLHPPGPIVTTEIGFPCHVILTTKLEGQIQLASLKDNIK